MGDSFVLVRDGYLCTKWPIDSPIFKTKNETDDGRLVSQEPAKLDLAGPVAHGEPIVLPAAQAPVSTIRPSKKRFALAFALAAVSDIISFWTAFLPPAQWSVDLCTALLLFLILGRRWAILPGLIFEAIPGVAAFPAWIFVVLSIFVYDDIKARSRKI